MDAGEIIHWLKSHGAVGLLNERDVGELEIGTRRVADLMQDRQWHHPDEIRRVAGGPTAPASEGLRRMRDLRPIMEPFGWEVARKRIPGTRLWQYRLQPVGVDLDKPVPDKPPNHTPPSQLSLFQE